MPSTSKAAFVCIGLSILQGIFNLRFINQETIKETTPEIIYLFVILVLLVCMVFRSRWACMLYIILTAAGLVSFVLYFIFSVRNTGAFSELLLQSIYLTPVRAFLQSVSVVLLLSRPTRTWYLQQA
jgi:hypothetical protein